MSKHKPVPGQLWQHSESQHCYRIIDSSSNYVPAGGLRQEWAEATDESELEKEVARKIGMVFYAHDYRDFVRREDDFLANFTFIEEAE
jgi:hypothetical protein